MKVKSIFFRCCIFACAAVSGFACSGHSSKSGEFTVKGRLSGVDDGVVIGVFGVGNDTVRNGRFSVTGKAGTGPELRSVVIMDDGHASWPLQYWVEPGAKIKIRGSGRLTPLWVVKSAVAYQKEENRYLNEYRDILAENVRIGIERYHLTKKSETASSEEEAMRYKGAVDSLGALFDSITAKRYMKEAYAKINIMETTDISPVWLYKMANLTGMVRSSYFSSEQSEYLHEKVWELYGRMSEEDKNTDAGSYIMTALMPPEVAEVGDNMADADLLDINGNIRHLADYAGKYLLIDFWNRSCGACIKAFPVMKELEEANRNRLTIISISTDSDDGWKNTITKYDMPWINIRDPKGFGGLAARYGVMAIPNYVMISPEGIIIDKWAGAAELKGKVSENMKIY
ncbi:MAG: TlpA family protein disulfide reductase [Bacteroidales bacterium]|jgi:thiol-disulfide isomerase/thioredoxin|nr:TlpA family protein disulfide reductase [Bacteroidales bacterium]